MPPIAVGQVENQNEPNGQHSVPVWVRFGFQLDSLEKHLITLAGLTFTQCNFIFQMSRVQW